MPVRGVDRGVRVGVGTALADRADHDERGGRNAPVGIDLVVIAAVGRVVADRALAGGVPEQVLDGAGKDLDRDLGDPRRGRGAGRAGR